MWGNREIPLEHYLDCSLVTARLSTKNGAASFTLSHLIDTQHIRQRLWLGTRISALAVILWCTARLCESLGTTRTTAALLLLLEVLGISTLGDSALALVSSTIASLVFSFYFIQPVGSLRLTTIQGAETFAAMVLTALTASQLSIRAQRRLHEAIHRREEMERLNQLGKVLISADTLAEAAERAVCVVIELFGLKGVVLRVESAPSPFQSGITIGESVSIPLDADGRAGVLELYGARLSDEVASALAGMIRLVLERARSSEERAVLEATRRGEELRSMVLNALAHNFKTPLTSIKAAASTLRGSVETLPGVERELITVIDEEADRLNQLIRESLELAKLEGRRANLRHEECLIAGVVERVLDRMGRFLEDRDLRIEIPHDLPPVTGDNFLLEQMVLQVVDNAVKYSRPGTPIGISAALTGKTIVLIVRNEGSAIPEGERDRIFEKFYRASNDRSAVEGTGLGLVIAKTIAERHGGKIWLNNEPQGPAFCFGLPLVAEERLHDREPHYIAD